MAMSKKERTQLLGLLIALGIGVPGAFWRFWRGPRVVEAQTMQAQLDSMRTEVDQARSDLQAGTVERLRATVARFERDLTVMRELVPTGSEFTSLINDISIAADLRDVKIISIQPQAAEFSGSFRVERYQYVTVGHYHAIGAFLADVASLRRVMVPYDISLTVAQPEEIQGLIIDTDYTYLNAQFMIRTFVKVDDDALLDAGETGTARAPIP